MIKKRKKVVYKSFTKIDPNNFWKEINKLYDDGWRVAEKGEDNLLKNAPVIMHNFIKVIFEKDSREATLEHIKTLTKADEFKQFCEEHNVKYDKSLCKTPTKFKKFLRDYYTEVETTKSKPTDVVGNSVSTNEVSKPTQET